MARGKKGTGGNPRRRDFSSTGRGRVTRGRGRGASSNEPPSSGLSALPARVEGNDDGLGSLWAQHGESDVEASIIPSEYNPIARATEVSKL